MLAAAAIIASTALPPARRISAPASAAALCGATTMPWPARDARMWQTVFPQMANWLPEDEAEQLRFEFAQEIERLKAA